MGEFFLAYSLVQHNFCQVSLRQKPHYCQLGGVDWADIWVWWTQTNSKEGKREVISNIEIVACALGDIEANITSKNFLLART